MNQPGSRALCAAKPASSCSVSNTARLQVYHFRKSLSGRLVPCWQFVELTWDRKGQGH